MRYKPRIVFTSSGAVCGAGLSTQEIWDSIQGDRSAIAPLRRWPAESWPVKVAAELHGVDNRTLVADRKVHKMLSRTDLLGLNAAGQAVAESGLLEYRESLAAEAVSHFNDRTGVFVGSGGGNYHNSYDFFPLLAESQGSMQAFGQQLGDIVNPMWLLRNLPNNVLCHVGIRYGFKGTNACVTNQCVGGISAVVEAAYALQAGEADRAVVAGHDAAIDVETMVNFHKVGLLATDTIRTFDAHREGTVLGEGAAAFVLETLERARARNANILGEFLGSGSTSEATGVLDIRPDGDGLVRAIQLAMEDAGLAPVDIGFVVAHGNGTHASDASEATALKTVFRDEIPPVTAFKWATGHTIAASGVLDLALALKALQHDVVPAIPTLRKLDPELAPFPAMASTQLPRGGRALVICRGFGGMNVVVIVSRWTSENGG